MKNLHIRSASGQLAEFLKEQIRSRRWTGTMPGESWMVTQLQVGRDTVRAAMAQLEEEGVLAPQGQGKRKQIVMREDAFATRKIRVRILPYEKQDRGRLDSSSLVAELLEAGMDADFSGKSLKEMGMKIERVARHVNRNPADAWVVTAASREVLQWFAEQPVPALAMFGRHTGLTIAAAYPIMIPGQTAAVRRLVELGHKRIVMLTREERREGFGRLLDELFRFSPPTALIFQEAQLFIAARSHLADRGIVAPRDVSMVVADTDPSFAWYNPSPSHIQWDYRPVVRRIVRWAKNVAAGKEDRRKSGTGSEFVEGGTIGPVPGRSGV